MTELAKFIFEQHGGSLVLNKKQVAKLMNKSVGYIDQAIHQNRKEKIPPFNNENGTVEFTVNDVAKFIENKSCDKTEVA